MVLSIVLLSIIIVPSRHTGIGAWVNSKWYTSILYNLILMQGYCTNTEYTGSLGYNSVSDGCLKNNVVGGIVYCILLCVLYRV